MDDVKFHRTPGSSRRAKTCVEGQHDHKEDRKDYSIPLYLAGIIFITILTTILY